MHGHGSAWCESWLIPIQRLRELPYDGMTEYGTGDSLKKGDRGFEGG